MPSILAVFSLYIITINRILLFRKCSIDDEPVAKRPKMRPLTREDFSSQEAYTVYLMSQRQLKNVKQKNCSLSKKNLRYHKTILNFKEMTEKLKNDISSAAANYLEVSYCTYRKSGCTIIHGKKLFANLKNR